MSLIESTGALLISGGIGPPKDNAEYTIDYLKIISSIQKGETMSTSSMRTIDHNSWYSAIWRRIRGENRIETIEKIKNIYLHYLDVYRYNPSEILYHSLLLSREGISNLEITYNSDVEIIKIIRDIPHPEKIVKCDDIMITEQNILNTDMIEQNNPCSENAVIIEQNNHTSHVFTNEAKDKMDVCDTIMLEKEICYVHMDIDDVLMSEKEINVVETTQDEDMNNKECVSSTEKENIVEDDTKQLNVDNIGIQDSVIIEEYTNSSVPIINTNLNVPVVENECPNLLFAVSFDITNNNDEGSVSPSFIEQNKDMIINDTEISASPYYDSIPSEKCQNLINKCNEVKQTNDNNSDLDIQDRLNMSIILLQETTAAKIEYTLNNNDKDKEPVKSVSDTPQYNNHKSKYNHGYIYESDTNKNEKDKCVSNAPSTPLQLKRNVSCYSSNLFKDEAKPPLIPSKRTNKKKYKEKKIIENKPKCVDKINTYGILFEDMEDKDIFKTKKMKID